MAYGGANVNLGVRGKASFRAPYVPSATVSGNSSTRKAANSSAGTSPSTFSPPTVNLLILVGLEAASLVYCRHLFRNYHGG